jgi:hypothetical protein
VPDTVRPVQVVANRENDVTGLAVDTHDVYHVSLFYGHLPLYSHGNRKPVPFD